MHPPSHSHVDASTPSAKVQRVVAFITEAPERVPALTRLGSEVCTARPRHVRSSGPCRVSVARGRGPRKGVPHSFVPEATQLRIPDAIVDSGGHVFLNHYEVHRWRREQPSRVHKGDASFAIYENSSEIEAHALLENMVARYVRQRRLTGS